MSSDLHCRKVEKSLWLAVRDCGICVGLTQSSGEPKVEVLQFGSEIEREMGLRRHLGDRQDVVTNCL